jgi:hypothetical protein
MMTSKWLQLGLFGVALVLNPYVACSSDEEDFTYSEQDMKTAVLGVWEGMADLHGESVPFTLALEQASAKSKTQGIVPPTVKPQCASRSFVKPAAACVSMSRMPLVGTVTSANPALNGAVSGELEAFRDLNPSQLVLTLEDGKMMTGTLKSDRVSDGVIRETGQVGSFSLARP